ncbi:hypothetical protein HOY80DRAFT_1059423 [Tuber brumale]|nr:hypothetical protein HOY80DRAFT_1059423 [Tuber brumale]
MASSGVMCRVRHLPTGPGRHRQGPAVTCRHGQKPGTSPIRRNLEGLPVRPREWSGRTPRCSSVPGHPPCTAVRPVHARRRTDWTLEFTAGDIEHLIEHLRANHERQVKMLMPECPQGSGNIKDSDTDTTQPMYHSHVLGAPSSSSTTPIGSGRVENALMHLAHGGHAHLDSTLYHPTGVRTDVKPFEKLNGILPETTEKACECGEIIMALDTCARAVSSNNKTGADYNVGDLSEGPIELENAFNAFMNCIDAEVTIVETGG